MPTEIVLSEDQVPRQWYNVAADLPTPLALSLQGLEEYPRPGGAG